MSFFKTFDWLTAIVYVVLVVWGWFTINAASYTLEGASIFDFERPSGKQAVWFGLALFLVFVILFIDVKSYMAYAPYLYLSIMALLLLTIFIGTNINGSHSWIKIGSFSIQPAEFGKFSTSLMLAWLFNIYGFKFTEPGNFLKACVICLLPVLLIILQNETGSALVYFSLILLFYRQGMSGVVLWVGFCFILIFVLGVKFGEDLVLQLIPFMVAAMELVWCKDKKAASRVSLAGAIGVAIYWIIDYFGLWEYVHTYRWIGLVICCYSVFVNVWLWLVRHSTLYLWVLLFSIGFLGLQYSVDYAFDHVLQDHQRGRIEVLLGMKEDLKGAGYNVNQAKIAIGSGGVTGKGYLQGTQTKLAYVPEQETDFIFCTIGEEQGFLGSSLLLALYGFLVVRLIVLAERQRTIFSLVYGYCVASIFAFHVIINVGMVIGLVPVIGIPLPFFSYGGSSLWSFTILLFIFLKLDSDRIDKY